MASSSPTTHDLIEPAARSGERSSPPARGRAGILALAAVLLAVPCLAWLFPTLAGDAQTELRPLAATPTMPRTVAELRRWPVHFDRYLNDHVPGRSELIELWSDVADLAASSSSREVAIGQHDWLFLRRDNAILDRARGFVRPTAAQLQNWVTGMRAITTEVESLGAVPWLVVVPNKGSVYPEFLPPWVRLADRSTAGMIRDTLRASGFQNFIDLRPVLRAAKDQGDLYWHTDSHWNGRGARIAYDAIMDELARHGLRQPRPTLTLVDDTRACDLTRLLGHGPDETETGPMLQVRDARAHPLPGYAMRYETLVREGYRAASPLKDAGKLLVFGDSFTEHDLWAALQESFSATTIYHHGAFAISRRVLREEKPSVVMIITAQRLLPLDGPRLVD